MVTNAIAIKAAQLGRSLDGTTAPDLAQITGCSLRSAQRLLASLVAAGVLGCDVPVRKGLPRGRTRNRYFTLTGWW